jgi:hypothetical protein
MQLLLQGQLFDTCGIDELVRGSPQCSALKSSAIIIQPHQQLHLQAHTGDSNGSTAA